MDRHGVMWQVSTQVPFPTIPLKLAQLFERSLRFCRCRRFLWLVSKKTHLYRIYVIYYMYPSIYMPYFQLVEQCAKRIKKDINKVFIGDKFDNSWVMFLVIKADNSKSSIFLGPHFRRTDDFCLAINHHFPVLFQMLRSDEFPVKPNSSMGISELP